MGAFRTTLLLQWKNILVMFGSPVATIFELIVPLIILLLIILGSLTTKTPGKKYAKTYVPNNESFILRPSENDLFTITRFKLKKTFLYAPETEFTKKLMTEAGKKLSDLLQEPQGMANETALLEHSDSDSKFGPQTVAVIFVHVDERQRKLEYKVRIQELNIGKEKGNLLQPLSFPPNVKAASENYMDNGFLAVQLAVDRSFIDLAVDSSRAQPYNLTPVAVQRFPFPSYKARLKMNEHATSLIMLTPLLVITNVIVGIMRDKLSGATELMKLMGLSRGMLWLSWFLRCFLVCEIFFTFFNWIIFWAFKMIPQSDPLLLWLTLTLFATATAAFICALSTLFTKGFFAVAGCLCLWVMFPTLLSLVEDELWAKSLAFQIPTMMVPVQAIYVAFTRIKYLEDHGSGQQWSNLAWTPLDDALTFWHVLMILLVQIFLYVLITWYLDAVRPGPYGVPARWNFCLKGLCRRRKQEGDDTDSTTPASSQANYETVPASLEVAIRVVNLRKKYASGKVAIDGVTLDVYEDQITALLGHNGAGKTSMMSILTGMIPSTSGDIWVYGYNTRTDLRRVRASMGLCPQDNMLFDKLSVKNHLVFFAMLKGCKYRAACNEALDLLAKLELTAKADRASYKLSGGMKRRLSLAIALIGGSRVVVLDEPTSGMDAEGRRKMWDLLQSMRGQRTILLTTHNMEEADGLGDRVAIMDHGRVQCYGSALYLKKRYGSGYLLKLLTLPHTDVDGVKLFVLKQLPSARLKTQLGAEVTFVLPQEQKGQFAGLFEAVEANKTKLGVISIGVSMATLDDVFIAVGNAARISQGLSTDEDEIQRLLREKVGVKRIRGLALKLQQMYAVAVKRLLDMRRNYTLAIIPVLFPVLFLFFAMAISSFLMDTLTSPEPALTLTLSAYTHTTLVYSAPSGVGVHLSALAKEAGAQARSVEDAHAAILAIGVADLGAYSKLVVAADMRSPSQVVGLYSGESYHGLPLAMNIINNAQLRAATGAADALITITSHPLERSAILKKILVLTGMTTTKFLWRLLVPFGLVILLGALLVLIITERACGSKRLQLMTGITSPLYWLANGLVDYLYFALVVVILLITFIIYDEVHENHYGGSEERGVFVVVFLVFGLAALPYTYLYSYISCGVIGIYAIFVIVNALIPLSPLIFGLFSMTLLQKVDLVLHLIPPYALGVAIGNFAQTAIQNNLIIENPMGQPSQTRIDFFESDVLGMSLLFLCADAVIYLALLAVIDLRLSARALELLKALIAKPSDDPATLDDDVKDEAKRVEENSDADTLSVKRLAKLHTLHCRRPLTVRGLSFGVPRGECFGLLGVNGSGKTTTFRMIVGDLARTRGFVRVRDPLRKQKKKYKMNAHLVGYCPQFDAFCESLTGREMLYVYARLRGVHCTQLRAHVNHWLLIMGLTEYEDKLCGTYSGGNKRKLSTAMALIGDPPLLLLDEPTCGVDPVARRNIWKVLASVQTADTAIVLTSHSMEESEALCSRVAIMVDGQFHCLGSSQHLKHKFGRGFTVLVTLRRAQSDPEAVLAFQSAMKSAFPSAVLKEEHQGLLNYHVTDTSVRWGSLFSGMEALKSKHANVEDYQVSETSLEQVFLSFARREENSMTD